MLSFHVKFVQTHRRTDGHTDGQTDGQRYIQTDGWTTVKQYAHDLSMRGHKKTTKLEPVFGRIEYIVGKGENVQ